MKFLRLTILDRYVLGEVLAPLVMGAVVITIALVTAQSLKLVELVVNHGVGLGEVLGLLGYIMPGLLELTLPMALLMGVLLGFGRLSGDQELTAARACGISLFRLAIPVLGIALVAWPLTSLMAFKVRPWANRRLREEIYNLMRTRTASALKEKVFNKAFPGLVLYVDEIVPPDVELKGVMISDMRDAQRPSTIIARDGVLVPDEQQGTITLRLRDGSIFGVESSDHTAHMTSFEVYDLAISSTEEIMAPAKDPKEMTYQELQATVAKGRASGHPDSRAEIEMASKFCIPVATVLFALLGVTLGIKPARGGQSERFGISLALFFLYWVLLRGGQTLAEKGELNAFVAMSIPDVMFAVLAGVLFYRSAMDRDNQSRGMSDFLLNWANRIRETRTAA